MSPQFLFFIIIGILLLDFIIDKVIDHLNAKHFNDQIPSELADVYNKDEYFKSQAYKKENYRFSLVTSGFSLVLTLGFFFFKGFAWVDGFARSYSQNDITVALIFFGVIMIGSDLVNTPFSYYRTFIIEEKYGFNKSSKKLFLIDKIKGWLLSVIIGGGVLCHNSLVLSKNRRFLLGLHLGFYWCFYHFYDHVLLFINRSNV